MFVVGNGRCMFMCVSMTIRLYVRIIQLQATLTCMYIHLCMHVHVPTVPVLKAGHPGVPSYYMFVCLGYGWVGCFTFLFFL